jgi:hypothetical protein
LNHGIPDLTHPSFLFHQASQSFSLSTTSTDRVPEVHGGPRSPRWTVGPYGLPNPPTIKSQAPGPCLLLSTINQSFNHSINQSINQSFNHSINQSFNQSINQSWTRKRKRKGKKRKRKERKSPPLGRMDYRTQLLSNRSPPAHNNYQIEAPGPCLLFVRVIKFNQRENPIPIPCFLNLLHPPPPSSSSPNELDQKRGIVVASDEEASESGRPRPLVLFCRAVLVGDYESGVQRTSKREPRSDNEFMRKRHLSVLVVL